MSKTTLLERGTVVPCLLIAFDLLSIKNDIVRNPRFSQYHHSRLHQQWQVARIILQLRRSAAPPEIECPNDVRQANLTPIRWIQATPAARSDPVQK